MGKRGKKIKKKNRKRKESREQNEKRIAIERELKNGISRIHSI